MLWFDVEMIRYTTGHKVMTHPTVLWFDVEMIRYTTASLVSLFSQSCGLM